jgi:hypothetical protein
MLPPAVSMSYTSTMQKLAGLGVFSAGVLLAACGWNASARDDELAVAPIPADSLSGGDASGRGDELEAAPIPADWISVEASCGFRFEAPPEVTFQDVQGIDSCVDSWTTHGCDNGGSFGGYNSDLSEYEQYPDHAATNEPIAGLVAKVVTARTPEGLAAAVHFPPEHDYEPDVTLTVWAVCSDGAGRQTALQSFRTITF